MRLLLITNVFPSPLLPTKGPFNFELVRALSRENEVRVVCPIAWTDEWKSRLGGRRLPKGRTAALEEAGGTKVHYPRYWFTPRILRQLYGRFMWQSVRRVALRQAEDLNAEAVIGYWAHPDGEVAVRTARLAGVPSAVMIGGSDVLVLASDTGRRGRILNVLKSADVVIAVSEDLREKLISFGISPGRVQVVARGVDTARFSPGDPMEARRRLGVATEGAMLLWVGRMHHVKGLDVLIEACARLKAQGMQLTLFLVGDGPERAKLQRHVNERGMAEYVSFVGPVAQADLPDWYRAADVMILPSRSEGVPNVLRESVACGTRFVASRVGGIPEIAPDPAWLVPTDDPASLAEGIEAAVRQGKWVPTGGLVAASGSWSDSARAVVKILKDAGAGKGAATAP